MSTLKIVIRNIFRYKRKSFAIFIAIFLSVVVMEFSGGFIDGFIIRGINDLLDNMGHIRIQHKDLEKKADMMPLDLTIVDYDKILKDLKTFPYLKEAKFSAQLQFGIMIINDKTVFAPDGTMSGDSYSVNMFCNGVAPGEEMFYKHFIEHKTEGRFIQGKDEVYISSVMKDILKIKLDDSITLLTPVKWDYYQNDKVDIINYKEFKVVGFFDTLSRKENEYILFCDMEGAQELLMFKDENYPDYKLRASEIRIILPEKDKAKEITQRINEYLGTVKMIPKGIPNSANKERYLEAKSYHEFLSNLIATMDFVDIVMFLVMLFIMIIAGVSITNILFISLFERFRIFGTMRAIGMKKRQLIQQITLESLIIGICASLLGLGVGLILVKIFESVGIYVGDSVQYIAGYIYTYASISTAIEVFIFGVLLSGLASLYPAIYASRLKPIKALSYL